MKVDIIISCAVDAHPVAFAREIACKERARAVRAWHLDVLFASCSIMKFNFCACATLFLLACGGKQEPPATSPQAATATAGAERPSCEAIDHACDPHEDEPGLPHECHELGESSASTEAQCAAKKDECLAACPAK